MPPSSPAPPEPAGAARRRAEEARLEAEARIAAQVEEARRAEAEHREAEERAATRAAAAREAGERAEQARLEAEARIVAQLEQARLEQARLADEARLAEEQAQREADERDRAEQARLEAEARIAAELEAARLDDARRAEEARAEEARRSEEERTRAPAHGGVDSVAAGREVVSALSDAVVPAESRSEERPARAAAPSAPVPTPEPAGTRDPAGAPTAPESGNAVFAPRTGARRLVGLVLLLAAGATAGAAYVAHDRRTTFAVGIAVTLGVLTLLVWAVRASWPTTRLSVTAGQLEVLRGGGRFVFDLRSSYTPIEVVGQPGERGWKVLFHRRSMAPFVIDSSMVDPEEFMRILRHHRPDAG
ncbi:hypothetical protein [Nocardioides sp. SYSU DS0663]|uniref:hypothetical protein n=1 Tax=Nocardioides sp. SYSU DS0663 TaxID=3416445 RepID=UPI003F4C4F38